MSCDNVFKNMLFGRSRGFVKNEKTLEVFFFDLGEIAECSLGEIKELPAEFHTSPPALVSYGIYLFIYFCIFLSDCADLYEVN